jgi:hypothetical protein
MLFLLHSRTWDDADEDKVEIVLAMLGHVVSVAFQDMA